MRYLSEKYIEALREKDFPWLNRSERIYFDNTATSQEPLSVNRENVRV
jgi:selenocysteine lyase/cysteine desulfurase